MPFVLLRRTRSERCIVTDFRASISFDSVTTRNTARVRMRVSRKLALAAARRGKNRVSLIKPTTHTRVNFRRHGTPRTIRFRYLPRSLEIRNDGATCGEAGVATRGIASFISRFRRKSDDPPPPCRGRPDSCRFVGLAGPERRVVASRVSLSAIACR